LPRLPSSHGLTAIVAGVFDSLSILGSTGWLRERAHGGNHVLGDIVQEADPANDR
jgi:hypothetical protein